MNFTHPIITIYVINTIKLLVFTAQEQVRMPVDKHILCEN